MSATGRGSERRADDFFETPAWCVQRLLERVWLPGGEWLEPAAGHGAIIRAVNAMIHGKQISWMAVDIRAEAREALRTSTRGVDVLAPFDFLGGTGFSNFDVILTNPPFSLAMEFITQSLTYASYVVMLLRLNFLGSGKRAAFFAHEMPDIYVLPDRPSFTGGGTDATEYAWFVWTPERGRRAGKVEVLAGTPAEQRRGIREAA